MLIRIKGVTLRDNVKTVDIREEQGMNSLQEKVREMRLRWYGHMQRTEENNEVRAVVDMIVPGKRPRGRWVDCVRREMQELRITPEDAQDRTFWKSSGKRQRRRRRRRRQGLWLYVLITHEVSLSVGEHGVSVDVTHHVTFDVHSCCLHLFLACSCKRKLNTFISGRNI